MLLDQNALWPLTLVSRVNLWEYVKIVQRSTENQKSALSHFRPKAEVLRRRYLECCKAYWGRVRTYTVRIGYGVCLANLLIFVTPKEERVQWHCTRQIAWHEAPAGIYTSKLSEAIIKYCSYRCTLVWFSPYRSRQCYLHPYQNSTRGTG
jgi:hypothetical protein